MIKKIPINLNGCILNENYKHINDFVVDSIVDAKAIMMRNFPIKENDVFISYSHSDINIINKIIYLIKKDYNLNCFVDSNVWNNYEKIINNLSKEIRDKEIYTNETDMYQIEHMIRDNVDVILTTSLMQVMNNSKLILLFDTENYKTYEYDEEFTYSPWIYHEICCAKYIDTNNQIFKPNIRHFSINESIKFKYSIEYVFDSIRLSDLFNWFNAIHSMQIDILSKKSIKLLYDTYEYSNYMGEK